jgi:hypothetical protein
MVHANVSTRLWRMCGSCEWKINGIDVFADAIGMLIVLYESLVQEDDFCIKCLEYAFVF